MVMSTTQGCRSEISNERKALPDDLREVFESEYVPHPDRFGSSGLWLIPVLVFSIVVLYGSVKAFSFLVAALIGFFV